MKKIASLALLVLGVVLLAKGWEADRAVWPLVAGGLAAVAGLAGLSR